MKIEKEQSTELYGKKGKNGVLVIKYKIIKYKMKTSG
jgi:hypothetical protein